MIGESPMHARCLSSLTYMEEFIPRYTVIQGLSWHLFYNWTPVGNTYFFASWFMSTSEVSWDILRNCSKHLHKFLRFITCAPMSAKEFYNKSPLHVPEIPPEVWINILRHATWDSNFPFPSELTFESIGMSRCASEHLRSFRKVLVSSYILLQ